MKLSISLSEEDVVLLDGYVASAQLPSRSAGIRRALRLLREVDLESDYADSWQEWESSGEEALWSATATDGLTRAPR